ncbi:hypothetical protein HK102_004100, partial [Quaeritorhiza haematococci]
IEELEEMLEDDNVFEEFFSNLEAVRNMKQVQRELRAGNENLARRNLEKEVQLQELQRTYEEQLKIFQNERVLFEEHCKVHQQESARFTPAFLLTKLRTAMQESEDLSESISISFLDGKMGAEDFLKQFREIRKVYHMRAAKVE